MRSFGSFFPKKLVSTTKHRHSRKAVVPNRLCVQGRSYTNQLSTSHGKSRLICPSKCPLQSSRLLSPPRTLGQSPCSALPRLQRFSSFHYTTTAKHSKRSLFFHNNHIRQCSTIHDQTPSPSSSSSPAGEQPFSAIPENELRVGRSIFISLLEHTTFFDVNPIYKLFFPFFVEEPRTRPVRITLPDGRKFTAAVPHYYHPYSFTKTLRAFERDFLKLRPLEHNEDKRKMAKLIDYGFSAMRAFNRWQRRNGAKMPSVVASFESEKAQVTSSERYQSLARILDQVSFEPVAQHNVQIRPGHLLLSHPFSGSPEFANTVVLVLHHDESGSHGVVINRKLNHRRGFPELCEQLDQRFKALSKPPSPDDTASAPTETANSNGAALEKGTPLEKATMIAEKADQTTNSEKDAATGSSFAEDFEKSFPRPNSKKKFLSFSLASAASENLIDGGPVRPLQAGLQFHQQFLFSEDLGNSQQIAPSLYWGAQGDGFDQWLLKWWNDKTPPSPFKLANTFTSWSPKQLQNELDFGVWFTVECNDLEKLIFSACQVQPYPSYGRADKDLFRLILSKLGGEYEHFAFLPPNQVYQQLGLQTSWKRSLFEH